MGRENSRLCPNYFRQELGSHRTENDARGKRKTTCVCAHCGRRIGYSRRSGNIRPHIGVGAPMISGYEFHDGYHWKQPIARSAP